MTQETMSAERRDQHIFELTGIKPDPRYHVPLEETQLMMRGVQAGDTKAMERLVATRLAWVYNTYFAMPELQERHDLSLADFMQIGSLATLEAAGDIDADSPIAHGLLYNQIPYIIGGLTVQTKLVPTYSPNGQKFTTLGPKRPFRRK